MIKTLESLPATFYSRTFYSDLFRRKGVGYNFVLIIFALCFISGAIRMYGMTKEFVGDMQKFFDGLPTVEIKDKKLSIDKPAPYIIDLFKEGGKTLKLMFDPAYKVDRLDKTVDYMEEKDAFIMITADKLAIRGMPPEGKFEIRDLDITADAKFTHADWIKIGEKVAKLAYPVFIVGLAAGLFVWTNILVFFMGIIALCLGLLMKVDLSLDSAMRLAAAAGIPIAIIGALIPLPTLPIFFVWGAYLIFALGAVQGTSKKI